MSWTGCWRLFFGAGLLFISVTGRTKEVLVHVDETTRKETIVHSRVKLGWCSFLSESNHSYFELIRLFGYRNPFSSGLAEKGLARNPKVGKQGGVEPGQNVLIPYYYLNKTEHPMEAVEDCYSMLLAHQLSPFVVRGHEAFFESDKDYFYPGIDIIAFRQQDQQSTQPILRNLTSEQMTPAQVFKPHSQILISAGLVFDVMSGESTGGSNIVSDMQPEVQLAWRQNWTEHFYSQFKVTSIFKSYLNSEDMSETLTGREFTQGLLDLHFGYRWGDNNEITLVYGVHEVAYYFQQLQDDYVIVQDRASVFGAEFRHSLLNLYPLGVGLVLSGRFYGSGSLKYQGGLLYGGGLEIGHEMENSTLRGQAVFETGEFSTEFFDYSQQFLKFNVSYDFNL